LLASSLLVDVPFTPILLSLVDQRDHRFICKHVKRLT
jgi:hypothetical protein